MVTGQGQGDSGLTRLAGCSHEHDLSTPTHMRTSAKALGRGTHGVQASVWRWECFGRGGFSQGRAAGYQLHAWWPRLNNIGNMLTPEGRGTAEPSKKDPCKAMTGHSWCCRSLCGGGDALGEVAFFTEIAQLEMVRTVSVCRILVIPRIAYNSIAAAFPIGARAILTNLLSRAQEVIPWLLDKPQ